LQAFKNAQGFRPSGAKNLAALPRLRGAGDASFWTEFRKENS
jgi:hypothetical protein